MGGAEIAAAESGVGDAESFAKPVSSGAEMVFQNICVDANGKRILWNVSGRALPGQMLALMGPSGKLYTP